MPYDNLSAKDIIEKYSKKLESQLNSEKTENWSQEYLRFRQEMVPELSRYERWARSIGNIIKLRVSEKDRVKIQNQLDTAHVDVNASQALTLSVVSMLLVFFLTILAAVAYYLISFPQGITEMTTAEVSDIALFIFLGVTLSMFIFYYTYSMPQRLANSWRLQASSQMVPAILYIVVYMKHTSNLERAIAFASQHLEGPLALDFKKIFYDVEIGKYPAIKQSLDNYLEKWRFEAPEFVESIHLIESSLLEPSESRRVAILEKSLTVILDGVYEKMLKYSRDIRSPLTNVYMLGIILPTLGLALLPLASTLLGGVLRWPHVFILFNLIIPFMVFYIVSEIMLKRPGGYGEASTLELNPDYPLYKSKKPWVVAFLVALPFFLIGILPFLMQIDFISNNLHIAKDYTFNNLGLTSLGNIKLFDFKIAEGKILGPFGPGAILLSLFIPLSIALFFYIAYKQKTSKLMQSRINTRKLEVEFANTLFQLGNRLGDGIPAEIAFGHIAQITKGQATSNFFALVNQNIQQAGMSLERALFDRHRGALIFYPSALISTSMKILTESVKKGLQVAARSLMSISEYVKNIEKINNRLRDLLAEIVSDMKSNMTFLAPLLSGVVVGLSAMITFILNKLKEIDITSSTTTTAVNLQGLDSITKIFDVTTMVPPYFLQIAVGVYIIEIVFILTAALVTVDAGKDKLREKYELAKNLLRSIVLYTITSFLAIVALTVLAGIALQSLGS